MKRLMTLATAVLLAGCGDSTGPRDDHLGTYTLQSVNGATPPTVVLEMEGTTVELVSGWITLSAADAWSGEHTFRITEDGEVTEEKGQVGGTYTLATASLTLRDADGETYEGLLSDRTITITDDGVTAVYRR